MQKCLTVHRPGCGLVMLAALLAPGVAMAEPVGVPALPPALDPGLINESMRHPFDLDRPEPQRKDAPLAVVAPPAPVAATPGTVRFSLKSVLFDASHYLSGEALQALAEPLVGREVGIDDLQKLVERINALYTERGLATARAVLPPQSIDDGTVRIRLVEGQIGKIAVTGASPRAQRRAQRAVGVGTGDMADPRDLERRLRLFNRENDSRITAALSPGESLGKTDLELRLVEPHRLGLEIFADNNGFQSTGTWEEGAVLRAFRLLGSVDRASVVVVHSAGVRSVSGAWSTPFLNRWRVNITASYGDTTIAQAGAHPLDIRGQSKTLGGDIAVALINAPSFSVHLDGAVTATRSDTLISGVKVVGNDVLSGGLALLFDGNTPRLTAAGRIEVTASHVAERVSGVNFDPLVVRGDLQLTRALDHHGTVLRMRADGQWTEFKGLPGLLQYQIGGARSARALDPGTYAGDRGFVVSLETARGLSLGKTPLELAVFADHTEALNSGQPAETATDVGAGVTAGIWDRFTVRCQYARVIDYRGPNGLSQRGTISVSARF